MFTGTLAPVAELSKQNVLKTRIYFGYAIIGLGINSFSDFYIYIHRHLI